MMIDLRALRQLLADEMDAAECGVIGSVSRSVKNATETEITVLLIVEAENRLRAATSDGRVAAAVQEDLERAYRAQGHAPPQALRHVTEGLVARLRKQQPSEERRTGADFGLLLVEPRFDLRWGLQLDLKRGGL